MSDSEPLSWRKIEQSIRRYFERRQEGCAVPERYESSNDLAIIVPEMRFDCPTGGFVEIQSDRAGAVDS